MTNKRRVAGILPFLLMAAAAVGANETTPVNADSKGVVLHGYDPVAYFTQNAAVKGDQKYQATYMGGTYYFASKANEELFKSNPAKYAPQYGGYCATAVSMGQLEDVDPTMFAIHDDKLYLQRNEKAHQMFLSNLNVVTQKADQQWPQLVHKDGK